MTEYWLRKLISAALYLTITIKLLRKLKGCVLSYLTFLTVNSKEPIAAEAHITVFLVQRHTFSIIFAWRVFTRTLWKSDWDIKNAWKMSPHFISYITLIYKFINNANSTLPLAKGVNIRFEDALQTKRAFSTKWNYFYCFYLSKNENSSKNPSNFQGQEGFSNSQRCTSTCGLFQMR